MFRFVLIRRQNPPNGPFSAILDPKKAVERLGTNKMPAILALRVMLGLIHLFQLYASPIDKTILANGIV